MMEPTKIGSLKKIFDDRGEAFSSEESEFPGELTGPEPVQLLRSKSLRPIGGKEREVVSR